MALRLTTVTLVTLLTTAPLAFGQQGSFQNLSQLGTWYTREMERLNIALTQALDSGDEASCTRCEQAISEVMTHFRSERSRLRRSANFTGGNFDGNGTFGSFAPAGTDPFTTSGDSGSGNSTTPAGTFTYTAVVAGANPTGESNGFNEPAGFEPGHFTSTAGDNFTQQFTGTNPAETTIGVTDYTSSQNFRRATPKPRVVDLGSNGFSYHVRNPDGTFASDRRVVTTRRPAPGWCPPAGTPSSFSPSESGAITSPDASFQGTDSFGSGTASHANWNTIAQIQAQIALLQAELNRLVADADSSQP